LGSGGGWLTIFWRNSQKAHPWLIWHVLSHYACRSVHGFFLQAWPHKKGHYKKSQRGYISPICGEFPTQPNLTKIGLWVGVADIINHTKFGNDRSREYKVTEGRVFACSIGMACCLNTVTRLCYTWWCWCDDNDGNIVGWLSGSSDRQQVVSVSDPRRRDVFLGGSCGLSRWRDEIAVPLLLLVILSSVLFTSLSCLSFCFISFLLSSLLDTIVSNTCSAHGLTKVKKSYSFCLKYSIDLVHAHVLKILLTLWLLDPFCQLVLIIRHHTYPATVMGLLYRCAVKPKAPDTRSRNRRHRFDRKAVNDVRSCALAWKTDAGIWR